MATTDEAHFDERVTALDRSVELLLATVGREPSVWGLGRPGKWTAGQHAEHMTKALEPMLPLFDERATHVGRRPAA